MSLANACFVIVIVSVVMEATSLASGPRDSGAMNRFLSRLRRNFTKGLSLVRSQGSVVVCRAMVALGRVRAAALEVDRVWME